MTRALRDVDVLARPGGDEFVLLLPSCLPEKGLQIAEGLRQRLSDCSAGSVPLTLSVGVAGAPPFPLESEILMRACDRALYRAKSEGRDRAALAAPHEIEPILDRD